MKIFKCVICKNPYIGKEKPSNCSYCGVFSRFFQEAGKISDDNPFFDNETENYMLRIYEDKSKNRIFYKKALINIGSEKLKNLVSAFENIENTHIQILEDLGISKNLTEKNPHVYRFEEDNITEVFQRKKSLVNFQKKILKRIYDPSLVVLLDALSEAEEAHLKILENYM